MARRLPEPSAFDSFNDFTVGDLCTFTPASDTLAQAIGFPRFPSPCDDDTQPNWLDLMRDRLSR